MTDMNQPNRRCIVPANNSNIVAPVSIECFEICRGYAELVVATPTANAQAFEAQKSSMEKASKDVLNDPYGYLDETGLWRPYQSSVQSGQVQIPLPRLPEFAQTCFPKQGVSGRYRQTKDIESQDPGVGLNEASGPNAQFCNASVPLPFPNFVYTIQKPPDPPDMASTALTCSNHWETVDTSQVTTLLSELSLPAFVSTATYTSTDIEIVNACQGEELHCSIDHDNGCEDRHPQPDETNVAPCQISRESDSSAYQQRHTAESQTVHHETSYIDLNTIKPGEMSGNQALEGDGNCLFETEAEHFKIPEKSVQVDKSSCNITCEEGNSRLETDDELGKVEERKDDHVDDLWKAETELDEPDEKVERAANQMTDAQEGDSLDSQMIADNQNEGFLSEMDVELDEEAEQCTDGEDILHTDDQARGSLLKIEIELDNLENKTYGVNNQLTDYQNFVSGTKMGMELGKLKEMTQKVDNQFEDEHDENGNSGKEGAVLISCTDDGVRDQVAWETDDKTDMDSGQDLLQCLISCFKEQQVSLYGCSLYGCYVRVYVPPFLCLRVRPYVRLSDLNMESLAYVRSIIYQRHCARLLQIYTKTDTPQTGPNSASEQLQEAIYTLVANATMPMSLFCKTQNILGSGQASKTQHNRNQGGHLNSVRHVNVKRAIKGDSSDVPGDSDSRETAVTQTDLVQTVQDFFVFLPFYFLECAYLPIALINDDLCIQSGKYKYVVDSDEEEIEDKEQLEEGVVVESDEAQIREESGTARANRLKRLEAFEEGWTIPVGKPTSLGKGTSYFIGRELASRQSYIQRPMGLVLFLLLMLVGTAAASPGRLSINLTGNHRNVRPLSTCQTSGLKVTITVTDGQVAVSGVMLTVTPCANGILMLESDIDDAGPVEDVNKMERKLSVKLKKKRRKTKYNKMSKRMLSTGVKPRTTKAIPLPCQSNRFRGPAFHETVEPACEKDSECLPCNTEGTLDMSAMLKSCTPHCGESAEVNVSKHNCKVGSNRQNRLEGGEADNVTGTENPEPCQSYRFRGWRYREELEPQCSADRKCMPSRNDKEMVKNLLDLGIQTHVKALARKLPRCELFERVLSKVCNYCRCKKDQIRDLLLDWLSGLSFEMLRYRPVGTKVETPVNPALTSRWTDNRRGTSLMERFDTEMAILEGIMSAGQQQLEMLLQPVCGNATGMQTHDYEAVGHELLESEDPGEQHWCSRYKTEWGMTDFYKSTIGYDTGTCHRCPPSCCQDSKPPNEDGGCQALAPYARHNEQGRMAATYLILVYTDLLLLLLLVTVIQIFMFGKTLDVKNLIQESWAENDAKRSKIIDTCEVEFTNDMCKTIKREADASNVLIVETNQQESGKVDVDNVFNSLNFDSCEEEGANVETDSRAEKSCIVERGLQDASETNKEVGKVIIHEKSQHDLGVDVGNFENSQDRNSCDIDVTDGENVWSNSNVKETQQDACETLKGETKLGKAENSYCQQGSNDSKLKIIVNQLRNIADNFNEQYDRQKTKPRDMTNGRQKYIYIMSSWFISLLETCEEFYPNSMKQRSCQRSGKHVYPAGTLYAVCKCRMHKSFKPAKEDEKEKSQCEGTPSPVCEKNRVIQQLIKFSQYMPDIRRCQQTLINIFCCNAFMRREIMLCIRICQRDGNFELLRRLFVRLVPFESVVERNLKIYLHESVFNRLLHVMQRRHTNHELEKNHHHKSLLCRSFELNQPLHMKKLWAESKKVPNDKVWQIVDELSKVMVLRLQKKACNPEGCMVDVGEMAGKLYDEQCFIDDECVARVAASSEIDTRPLKRISSNEWIYVPKKASRNTTEKFGSCEPIPEDLDHLPANVEAHGTAADTTEIKKVSCQTDTRPVTVKKDIAEAASTDPIVNENLDVAAEDSFNRAVNDDVELPERLDSDSEDYCQNKLLGPLPVPYELQKELAQLKPEVPTVKVMPPRHSANEEQSEQSGHKYFDEQFLLKRYRIRERKDAYSDEEVTMRILRDHTWLPVDQLPPARLDLRRVVVANITYAGLDAIFRQIALGNTPGPAITMKYELLRLCTLRNYPKTNKPYLIRLAASGFYYAADGDEVVCYCCGVRRNGWIERDVPDDVHKRLSPKCSFFVRNAQVNYAVPRQLEGAINKFAFLEEIVAPYVEDEGEDQSNDNSGPASRQQLQRNGEPPVVTNSSRMSTSSLGINTSSPKHPHYAVKQVRVNSFVGWPESSHQEPTTLAEAGFYYAGIGDCVRCFYCGVGLRHWAAEDNPWIEHARWAQTCAYLRQYKGDEFISLVHMAINITRDEEPSAPGSQPNEEITRVLMTDAAQSVVEMGYDTRIIRRAIDSILRDTGRTGMTAQRIMEKVLELEEEQQSVADEPTPPPTSEMSQLAINKHNVDPGNQATPQALGAGSQTGGAATDTGVAVKADSLTGKASAQPGQDPKKVKEENEKLKEQTLCKICMDRTVCIVFLPCGHLVTCAECAPALRKCPICRSLVKGTVKTYMS